MIFIHKNNTNLRARCCPFNYPPTPAFQSRFLATRSSSSSVFAAGSRSPHSLPACTSRSPEASFIDNATIECQQPQNLAPSDDLCMGVIRGICLGWDDQNLVAELTWLQPGCIGKVGKQNKDPIKSAVLCLTLHPPWSLVITDHHVRTRGSPHCRISGRCLRTFASGWTRRDVECLYCYMYLLHPLGRRRRSIYTCRVVRMPPSVHVCMKRESSNFAQSLSSALSSRGGYAPVQLANLLLEITVPEEASSSSSSSSVGLHRIVC